MQTKTIQVPALIAIHYSTRPKSKPGLRNIAVSITCRKCARK